MNKTDKLHALNGVLRTLYKKQKQAKLRGEDNTARRLNETARKLENYISTLKSPVGKP